MSCYDRDLGLRLRAAGPVIVLDFGFLRCAWRTLQRGREQADYWRWVWGYRRHSLPSIQEAFAASAPGATVYVLRNPAAVRRFLSRLGAVASPGVSSGRSRSGRPGRRAG
jgi:hypothetical protein